VRLSLRPLLALRVEGTGARRRKRPSGITLQEDSSRSGLSPRCHLLTPPVYCRLPLTRTDYAALHQAKLLGDCQWAMVPLQISLPSLSATKPLSSSDRDFSSALEISSWLLNIASELGQPSPSLLICLRERLLLLSRTEARVLRHSEGLL
jgi:hypothetical protein